MTLCNIQYFTALLFFFYWFVFSFSFVMVFVVGLFLISPHLLEIKLFSQLLNLSYIIYIY